MSSSAGEIQIAALDKQRRMARRRRNLLQVARIALILLILAAWQLASGWLIGTFWISKPSAVLTVLWHWIVTGSLWPNLGATLIETVLGFVIGSIGGIAAGILLGRLRFLGEVTGPLLTMLYSVPRIALAPLFVLWFGIGLQPKVVLSAFIVFFLTLRATIQGVESVPSGLVDTMKVMGASRRDILQKVVLPAAVGSIFVGLRLSIPYALVGAVVGEFVASSQGLGNLMNSAAGLFDTKALFAAMIVLMIIGLVLDRLTAWLEGRLSRWKTAGGAGAVGI